MAGGADEAFARAKPLLETMGKRIVHCGGARRRTGRQDLQQHDPRRDDDRDLRGVRPGRKLGLSAEALYEVASNSSGQSWSLTSYCPVPGPVPASPANRGYKPGFAAALMLKDLRLAQEAAASAGAATPLGAQAAQLYQIFAAAGRAGDDFSGIIELVRGMAPEAKSE